MPLPSLGPGTVIATLGDEIVGMVSLWASDCPLRPNLTPWAASLFVARPLCSNREHRHASGIGQDIEASKLPLWHAGCRGLPRDCTQGTP